MGESLPLKFLKQNSYNKLQKYRLTMGHLPGEKDACGNKNLAISDSQCMVDLPTFTN